MRYLNKLENRFLLFFDIENEMCELVAMSSVNIICNHIGYHTSTGSIVSVHILSFQYPEKYEKYYMRKIFH